MPTVAAIKTLVKDITVLSNSLPRSVQQATKDNKIWSIMNAGQGETAHETFNRCFDAMFGQECRDSTGCLKHIRKGKLGMGLVCSYLSKCDWADGFPLDLVEIKLVRLVEELKHLRGSDVDSTTQTQPSRNVAPTSKLTDANDAAQPELSFQRQAIEAFHTRAQEATSPLTSIDTGHTIHAANPPTRPSPKRTVSAIVDADTEQPESGLSGGDQDTDGQPFKKRRMGPKTSSTSKSKHIISVSEDDDGEDEVDEGPRGPSQTRDKSCATLGNPTDVDEEGLLADVNVQPVHNTTSTYGDKRHDINEFFNPAYSKTINGIVKKYCLCKVCPDDKSIVNEVTTLRRHLEAYHAGKYCKWAEENNFESRLLGDIRRCKAAAAELVVRTLDHDLVEKKIMERIVKYTDQSFHQAAIEWLIATDCRKYMAHTAIFV